MKRQKWLPLSLALICGIALGAMAFVLVHKYEPGFTEFQPSGVIIDEYPMETLLHSQLGGGGLISGALLLGFGVLFCAVKDAREPRRKAGLVLTVIGTMLLSASALQNRFDAIYPSAAAVDQLAHECKESGRQPCMTVPQGDR
jgi:hypothetical protein